MVPCVEQVVGRGDQRRSLRCTTVVVMAVATHCDECARESQGVWRCEVRRQGREAVRSAPVPVSETEGGGPMPRTMAQVVLGDHPTERTAAEVFGQARKVALRASAASTAAVACV